MAALRLGDFKISPNDLGIEVLKNQIALHVALSYLLSNSLQQSMLPIITFSS